MERIVDATDEAGTLMPLKKRMDNAPWVVIKA
jgi:hypothetical protein